MGKLVARRYAVALFETGIDLSKVDEFYKDLQGIKGTIELDSRLIDILSHPKIRDGEKKSMLEELFKSSVEKETMNFLYILVDKRRQGNILEIIDEFNTLYKDHKGIVDVVAITAVSMDPKAKEDLSQSLSKKLKKEVNLVNQVDPSVLGGVFLKIGDKLIDGTVKGHLDSMARTIVSAGN